MFVIGGIPECGELGYQACWRLPRRRSLEGFENKVNPTLWPDFLEVFAQYRQNNGTKDVVGETLYFKMNTKEKEAKGELACGSA